MPQTSVPPVWGSAAGASVAGGAVGRRRFAPAGALLSTLGASVGRVVPLSESPPASAGHGDEAERGQRRDDDERAVADADVPWQPLR